jgi:hypothetical protein
MSSVPKKIVEKAEQTFDAQQFSSEIMPVMR